MQRSIIHHLNTFSNIPIGAIPYNYKMVINDYDITSIIHFLFPAILIPFKKQ